MRANRGALGCVVLSLAGLGLCIYLGFLHIALLRGELVGGAACGGAGSVFNCHAVTAGRMGSAFGMPLWVWGLIGYLAALNLASFAWLFPDWTTPALTLLSCLSLVFVGIDAALFTLMVTQIRYLCLLCLMTYVVNLSLLVVSKRALAQPWSQVLGQVGGAVTSFLPSTQRPATWLFWIMMGLGVFGSVGLHAATSFVSQGSPGMVHKQIREFVSREPRVYPEISSDPSVGPSNAPIQVIEFSDFFCPVCQRASKFNTIILASHRQDVRFVFKQFPLDTSCNDAVQRMVHPGACAVAAAAECAHLQRKFWSLHDRIFEEGHLYNPKMLEQDAARLGLDAPRFQACLASGEGLAAVKRDVAEGKRIGVASTPTYVVNGLKVSGVMTPAMFEQFVAVLRNSDQSP